jgi:hypothetical protein
MSTNREADASMNGYFYQRYCCIYFLLSITYFKYILEEGDEDIDVININNDKELIQVKYYGSTEPESLNSSCGLLKVILANFNKELITKIIYYAYNKSSPIFQKNLKEAFDKELYFNIGKYVLILLFNKFVEEKEKIKISIKNILNIDKIYSDNYLLLKEKLESNSKYGSAFNFFGDENNCNNYFSKFGLKDALSYEDLNLEINKLIEYKYTEFINTNNNSNKNLRIELVKNTILNILTDTMFKAVSTSERLISSTDINTKINEKIQILTNTDNLYNELLKQLGKSLINCGTNEPIYYNILVQNNLNIINNLKIESYDNLCFYVYLLYNFYEKIDEEITIHIKSKICKIMANNIVLENNDLNCIKLVRYSNTIVNYTPSSCYTIDPSTIFKLIGIQHNSTNFFKI